MHELLGNANRTEKKDGSGVIYTVPVVVHVFHDNCNGNISLEQIKDGLRVVNDDFRRINSDTSATRAIFKPFAGDAEDRTSVV